MGTAEAAAAAAPADEDPSRSRVARRLQRRRRDPPPPVAHAVLAGLHLPHSARETPEPGGTGDQQQAALHHR